MSSNQYILAATLNRDAQKVISDAIGKNFTIESSHNLNETLEKCKKKRYEFIFIDVEFLGTSMQYDFQKSLYTVWKLYPTIEIVILCHVEKADALAAR